MRRIIAVLLLVPAVILLNLSNLIDPEPGSEFFIKVFKEICDRAGLSLVEK